MDPIRAIPEGSCLWECFGKKTEITPLQQISVGQILIYTYTPTVFWRDQIRQMASNKSLPTANWMCVYINTQIYQ